MNGQARNRGFTLVELMIVMVIVAVLAMIAVPSYQQSVLKSRRADGRVVLNDTAQRLERCYTQFGGYNGAGCAIVDGEVIDSPEGFYSVTVDIPDATTYTLTAAPAGAQVDDTRCGDLGLDNTGVRTTTGTDTLDHCW
ncbi:MAG: type IV pilin protein [Gammaproteobacteria bacterium PRO9]|nr:type IV pilin protein [Gammaproteobacteria bacterium PRO9]